MNKLIILRGPSGSGKSTIARFILSNSVRFADEQFWSWHEADQFFQDDLKRAFRFNYDMLGVAHRWCQANVERDLFFERSMVVVANTSMVHRDVMEYFEIADKYGYEVDVIKTPGPWDVDILLQRNVHGVPRNILERQIRRYQPMACEVEWNNLEIFKNGS